MKNNTVIYSTHEVHGQMDEYERTVASEAKSGVLRNDHILAFGVVFETLLTVWVYPVQIT